MDYFANKKIGAEKDFCFVLELKRLERQEKNGVDFSVQINKLELHRKKN